MNAGKSIFFYVLVAFFMQGVSVTVWAQAPDNYSSTAEDLRLQQTLIEDHVAFRSLLTKLEKKSDWSTAAFLEYIFYTTHRKLLKNYQKYSALNELFESGKYDCVSASLAYSVILDQFSIPYALIETDFHVFLLIAYNKEAIIFEVTDPINGFIKDKNDVAAYIASYAPDKNSLGLNTAIEIGENTYLATEGNTIYNSVSFMQLYALQHYNQGILALNNKEYAKASESLQLAHSLYPSERISAILEISESLLP